MDALLQSLDDDSLTTRDRIRSAVRAALAPDVTSASANSLASTLLGIAAVRPPKAPEERAGWFSSLVPSDLFSESADPASQRQLAVDRLTQLALLRPLRLVAKAADIQTEHQNVFRVARIFTDVRPVFDDESEYASLGVPSFDRGDTEHLSSHLGDPRAAVIVHVIAIDYIHDSSTRSRIFLSMDEDDLRSLRDEIDRALEKNVKVDALLQAAGLKSLLPLERK